MCRIRSYCLYFLLTSLTISIYGCGGTASPEFNDAPNSSIPSGETPASSVSNSSLANTSSGSTSSDVMSQKGGTLYAEQCASCHGANGQGAAAGGNLKSCSTCGDYSALVSRIETSMPLGASAKCDLECSQAVARFILDDFSTVASSASTASSVKSSSSSISNTSSSIKNSSSSSSSSSRSATGGAASSLAGVIYQETFENTAVNSQPSGWDNFLGYNYNTSNTTSGSNYALVDNSRSYNGSNSIHFKGSLAQIVRALPANTQRLHIRAFVNMSKQMGNVAGDNHEHIMGIKKTQDANNEIRVGQIKGVLGTNQVPTDNIAPKSDKWYSGTALLPNTWYCVETAFYADTAYDQLYLWVDGNLIHSITSDSDWNNGAIGKDWLSDKFNYVMFGFQSFSGNSADVWMDDLVVSTQPIGCGNISNSSSSTASSKASSSSSTNSSVAMGKALYEGSTYGCTTCHGSKGDGLYKIDPTKETYGNGQSLANYISDYMPNTKPASCTGTCAENLAAYIRSWASSSSAMSSSSKSSSSSGASVSSLSSIADCAVSYGPRSMRVLTRNEFTNSIYDLTGVDLASQLGQSTFDALPADNIINGFSNNVLANVESGSLQAYSIVVGKVVDLLASQNFTSILSCGDLGADACGTLLIENFAPKVFRRPLTEAEQLTYQELFTSEYTGGDVKEGLKLALRTLLTSPQFLYRDETGVSIQTIKNGGGSEPVYEPAGTPVVIFSKATAPGYHAGNYVNYKFTGKDLLELVVKAEKDGSGNWPVLTIAADGTTIATLTVDHNYNKRHRILLSGMSNNDGVYFGFVAANGDPSVIVDSAQVSAAKEVVPTAPPVELDDDAYVLTPYQLASYLSFTFAGTTPDDTLLKAAAEEGLETDAQIAAQVDRLIATTKAHKHFGNFAAQWLRTDRVLDMVKDTELYPKFTTNVRKAMAQEVRDVFNHVVLDGGEPFTKLFDGDFTFVNQTLADFYGISGVTGTNMQKVTGLTDRAGLVTSGAFMTVNAHEKETGPILRSTYLRRGFLCHKVPAPPTGVSLDGDDVDALREQARQDWEAYLAANGGKATARKKYEFQTSATLCQTCHAKMINPLGGGMEDFNAVGLPQAVDYNSLAIDSSGILYGVNAVNDDQVINFNGAKALAHAIAGLDATRQCFIDNSFRLAMGTGSSVFDREKSITLSSNEIQSYSCEIKRLDNLMKNTGNSTRALLEALGTMESARYRKDVQR